MKTIFKYPFLTTDSFTINMPKDSTILTVKVQNERPCMWVMIDPYTTETDKRKFRVFGTGHSIETDMLYYIGSYMLQDGGLVFHLFEEIGG